MVTFTHLKLIRVEPESIRQILAPYDQYVNELLARAN